MPPRARVSRSRLTPSPVADAEPAPPSPDRPKPKKAAPRSRALSAEALQTEPVLVNLPSLNFIAALLLAELHGRMGYFPPVLRLRPEPGSLPPQYEVAEILNLQSVRDGARRKRYAG